MNRLTVAVSVLLLLIGASGALGQKNASISSVNACIQDSVFTFDIVFHPTADWNNGYESGIGNSSWFFNFTKDCLTDPEISYVSPHVDPVYGYDNSVDQYGNKIGITTRLDYFNVGGVNVTPDSAIHLYTLTLKVLNADGLQVTWDQANTGIFDSRDHYIQETFIDYDSLLATSIVQREPNLPEHYQLYQNFPNPFNPSTSFEYQIPEAGNVELSIYNLLGRRIQQLQNGMKQAGKYRLTWNATDNQGRPVPAGIYLLKLNAGAFTKVIRMVLVK